MKFYYLVKSRTDSEDGPIDQMAEQFHTVMSPSFLNCLGYALASTISTDLRQPDTGQKLFVMLIV